MTTIFIAPPKLSSHISVLDLGVTRGEGVFETLLAIKKNKSFKILQIEEHLERFDKSLIALDFQIIKHSKILQSFFQVLEMEAKENEQENEFILRIFVTAGIESKSRSPQTVWVTACPRSNIMKNFKHKGISVMTLCKGYHSDYAQKTPWSLAGIKSTSYASNMSALRYAQKKGFQDAIFMTKDGYILEGTTSNVVILNNKTLYTPDPSLGLLHGTTQRKIYKAAISEGYIAKYAKLTLSDLLKAEAAWLTSSIKLFVPLEHINSNPFKGFKKTKSLYTKIKDWIYK